MSAHQPSQRQQEIADRQASARMAQEAATKASTQSQAEGEPGRQPTQHWWLHPRDFADNPN